MQIINSVAFGNRLRELLKEKKLSHEAFALEIKVSRNTITDYCKGKRPPSVDNLFIIAKYFDVSIDYLLEHTLNIPISDIGNIFNGGLKRKTGITVTMGMMKVIDGNSVASLRFERRLTISDSHSLYPRNEGGEAVSALMDYDYIEDDNYEVINGNIYREIRLGYGNKNSESNYNRFDTSIYDYANDGESLAPYIKAYNKERTTLGMIGMLKAEEFYLLNYVLGYHAKAALNQ